MGIGDPAKIRDHDRTMQRTAFRSIRVTHPAGPRTAGGLLAGPLALPVALGRAGIRANKREGDGGTPRGRFRLLRLWWRADRVPRPRDPAAGAPDRRRTTPGARTRRPALQPAVPAVGQ